MKKHSLLLVFYLLSCPFLFANGQDAYRQAKLKEVLHKLLDGLSFQGEKSPQIGFKESGSSPASYNKYKIYIEGSAYDILEDACLLDEGLALLIGHELGHFELDTVFIQSNFSVVPVDMEGFRLQTCGETDQRGLEGFCDYFGCFAAYRAGYDIWEKMPSVFDVICDKYDCNDLGVHQPQELRVESLESLRNFVEQMAKLFDLATMLTIIGEHEKARKCYRSIEQAFPSREIKNNIAVSYLLESLPMLSEPICSFAFPFEIDHETRLREGVRATVDEKIERGKVLIKLAIERLVPLAQKYPEYTPALFNLGSAFLLAENYEMAQKYFKTSLASSTPILKGKSDIGIAIAQYLSTKNKEPLQNLSNTAPTANLRQMANLNLQKINGNYLPSDNISQEMRECKKLALCTFEKPDESEALLSSNFHFKRKKAETFYFSVDDKIILMVNDSQLQIKGKNLVELRVFLGAASHSSSVAAKLGTYYIFKEVPIYSNFPEGTGLVVFVDDVGRVDEYFLFRLR